MVLRIVRVVDPFSANEFDDQLAVNVGVSRACTEPGAGSPGSGSKGSCLLCETVVSGPRIFNAHGLGI